MTDLTIAMPKGRIFTEAIALFQQSGLPIPDESDLQSRKLIVQLPEVNLSFFLAKPMDVATYVEYGVADLGVVGKDVLLEESRDVYELLDLRISPCRIAVAGMPNWKPRLYPRIATKYPHIAEKYFKEQGQQVEVIRLNGSIELAPLIGLADRIVDIVSTGQTLRENGLIELEHITTVTSRLIANRASFRMKQPKIDPLVESLTSAIQGGSQG
ncbi:ATP phosphoribosyltransferase [Hazenella coriacea]|nr:ATP phosphoribosyltransferase [Hazenella coriacea]